jgi:hypothetical protein
MGTAKTQMYALWLVIVGTDYLVLQMITDM